MPVLLMTPADVERWLEGAPEEALEPLRLLANPFQLGAVSMKLRNPSNTLSDEGKALRERDGYLALDALAAEVVVNHRNDACQPALEAALDAPDDRALEVNLRSRLCGLARPVNRAPKVALHEQAELGHR
jgi:hypothetical protein